MPISLRKRLASEQTPIIDGHTVTFVWSGKNPPLLVGDFTGWDLGNSITMDMREPGIWTHQLVFPDDAYIEYGYLRREKSFLDPRNPRVKSNGIGGFNNYFCMPSYNPTHLNRKNRKLPLGTVTSHSLPTEYLIHGKERMVHLYQPACTEPVSLVVVWDGQDYLRRMHLNYIVDHLIYQGRIQPLALAFVENGGQRSRMVEYACSDATLIFLMTKVLPLTKTELNLIDIDAFPGAYGVLGASMGGLMALYTGVRVPHVFGQVLSQSGAFPGPGFESVVSDLLKKGDIRPLKIWMDVGAYDLAGLLDSNRKMYSTLFQNGYPVDYREYHAGHNYPAWGDDIWRGLEVLFGTGK